MASDRWAKTQLDALQRRPMTRAQMEQKRRDEDWQTYMWRRGKKAMAEANYVGPWSVRHCESVLAWRQHLRRHGEL